MTTVLHLIETSGPGGAEKMLISLVDRLDRRRYRSVICLLKEGWLAGELRRRGFPTWVMPQRRGLDPGWVRSCARLIERERVGLLHAHEFTMNVYGCMAACVKRRPLVTTVHGKAYYPEKWRRRAAYRLVARRSKRMVAVSYDIRRSLIEQVGLPPKCVVTIHNGIDRDTAEGVDGGTIRRELGIAETAPLVGCVGSLYPVKGHRYLLQAASQVIRVFREALFLIVGKGPLLSELQTQAQRLGIADNVRFLGFREDVRVFLRCLDVFALPSLSEGLPLSLLEAMAAAKPVVATAVGGNPEVVDHGETGFLVPREDPESLAARIIELLRDRPLAERLGRSGRRRIEEVFSLEGMLKAYESVYESCQVGR